MMLNFEIRSDEGELFGAYLALPQTQSPAPAVLIIQEIFGINANIRAICDEWAAKGYVALAPDLFWRQEPGIELTDQSEAEWQRAFALYNGFDVDMGIADLKAALRALREHPACNGTAGSLGYCLGGKLAYLMATRSDADANISYYGVAIDAALDEAKQIKKPILMHVAEKDKFVPAEAQAKIKSALSGNAHVDLRFYPNVDHAFCRIGGAHFDENAARKANQASDDFFAKHLAKK